MKKISEIYKHYEIMPQLQDHMYRVAAVASFMCGYYKSADKDKVVSACLLHDTANIIKFKLEYYPQFLEPQGLEYWKKIQNSFKEKYGEEHRGTYMIAQEIGVSAETLKLIDSIGLRKACENALEVSFEKKICAYSDMRVGPHGVLPLMSRLNDLKERRLKANNKILNEDENQMYSDCLCTIEQQLFTGLDIQPSAVNDDALRTIIEKLKDFVPL